jgi:hypothetical protein
MFEAQIYKYLTKWQCSMKFQLDIESTKIFITTTTLIIPVVVIIQT